MHVGDIETRAFGIEHLEDAAALSRQAGWPHRLPDWQTVLGLSQGVVAVNETGRVVGTALMTPYGNECATINMVIVDARMRGRGVGRHLMDAALKLAGERSLRLVATAEGLPLYEKLGFRETGAILQHQGIVGSVAAPGETQTAAPGDLTAIIALDREAFGADRAALIARLAEIGEVAVLRRNAGIVGFACIRAFGRGEVIGPVVATCIDDAKALIAHFMNRRTGAFLRVDTGAGTGLAPWLIDCSLAHVGGGVAMARPLPVRPAASTVHTFALANQALG